MCRKSTPWDLNELEDVDGWDKAGYDDQRPAA